MFSFNRLQAFSDGLPFDRAFRPESVADENGDANSPERGQGNRIWIFIEKLRDSKLPKPNRARLGIRARLQRLRKKGDPEGGGGFNPRIRPTESMRALRAAEKLRLVSGHDFSRAASAS